MKILAISNFFPPHHAGGYGLLCYRLVSGLQRRGHQVTVLTTDPLEFAQAHAGARHSDPFTGEVIRRLRLIPARNSRSVILRTLHNHRVVQQVLRADFDLIYCFSMDEIGFDLYQTALSSGIPAVTVIGDTWLAQAWRNLLVYDPWSGLLHPRKRGPVRRLASSFLRGLGHSTGIFSAGRPRAYCTSQSISRFLHEDLIQSGAPVGSHCAVIPVPLPREYFTEEGQPIGPSGVRAPELRALFVGRMELLKGPDTAIQAVAEAVRAGANVTLTLTGLRARSGEVGQQLATLAKELGIDERLRWADAPDTTSLIELYRHHDVFLFPSRIIEGFGMVNAEAMACGLPVLGTGIGGSAEVIVEGETGYRFAPGDHQVLGPPLSELPADPDLLEHLSQGPLQMAMSFEFERVMDRVEELLAAVADDSAPANSAAFNGEPSLTSPSYAGTPERSYTPR